ncbi:TPA: DUF3173 domain-containing protein [Streptococcus suis]|uniref:DUF3173 domain-containing protein n=2 Tax=Streptococcus suis TaxID=1307 RepID=UPI0006ACE28B|nr:DUF3173 domain-containing protein [Streptococcus suis]AUC91612.1 DUF3173 domain-containing protein [Streptococcus suis]HEM3581155.1 DUF3173 domain-containing protein [Streptococcus suis]HEM5199636.1 DUF3173 domain-containing protein [Streptococcus suis]HEM5212443.1 DUF3173 domain-containing protein [Streptococcus suis]HEM5217461.1 DUF3173 domain-containing protein [Streptococcus suis]
MMTDRMIEKSHLIKMGFTKYQATGIIKQVKLNLVNQGYYLYNNKRLGIVPASAVESFIGVTISEETEENGKQNPTKN